MLTPTPNTNTNTHTHTHTHTSTNPNTKVGYLVEKSLSVDNLLVILLIFKHFKIRPGRQVRVRVRVKV